MNPLKMPKHAKAKMTVCRASVSDALRMVGVSQNGASRAAATWTGRSQDGVSGSERVKRPTIFRTSAGICGPFR